MQAYTATTPTGIIAGSTERTDFVKRTYLHLAGAVLAFGVIESWLLQSAGALTAVLLEAALSGWGWIGVLGAFMLVSVIAERWARGGGTAPLQYAGLGLYVIAQAVIFLPIMHIAARYSSPDVIPTAGLITAGLFMGLTLAAQGRDFSFLRGFLTMGFFIAMGTFVASLIFGFTLGTVFAAGMVGYAAAAILYQTSNVLREYRTDEHVAASLALFASVALLFWYVLQLTMALSDD